MTGQLIGLASVHPQKLVMNMELVHANKSLNKCVIIY